MKQQEVIQLRLWMKLYQIIETATNAKGRTHLYSRQILSYINITSSNFSAHYSSEVTDIRPRSEVVSPSTDRFARSRHCKRSHLWNPDCENFGTFLSKYTHQNEEISVWRQQYAREPPRLWSCWSCCTSGLAGGRSWCQFTSVVTSGSAVILGMLLFSQLTWRQDMSNPQQNTHVLQVVVAQRGPGYRPFQVGERKVLLPLVGLPALPLEYRWEVYFTSDQILCTSTYITTYTLKLSILRRKKGAVIDGSGWRASLKTFTVSIQWCKKTHCALEVFGSYAADISISTMMRSTS